MSRRREAGRACPAAVRPGGRALRCASGDDAPLRCCRSCCVWWSWRGVVPQGSVSPRCGVGVLSRCVMPPRRCAAAMRHAAEYALPRCVMPPRRCAATMRHAVATMRCRDASCRRDDALPRCVMPASTPKGSRGASRYDGSDPLPRCCGAVALLSRVLANESVSLLNDSEIKQ